MTRGPLRVLPWPAEPAPLSVAPCSPLRVLPAAPATLGRSTRPRALTARSRSDTPLGCPACPLALGAPRSPTGASSDPLGSCVAAYGCHRPGPSRTGTRRAHARRTGRAFRRPTIHLIQGRPRHRAGRPEGGGRPRTDGPLKGTLRKRNPSAPRPWRPGTEATKMTGVRWLWYLEENIGSSATCTLYLFA